MSNTKNIVQMLNINKQFPGVKAVDDVSFSIERGKVHALCGENGAGKSTLMQILSGIYTPDSGEILVRGTPTSISRPMDAMNLGISMIHQELALIPEMTVSDNIFMGRELCLPYTSIVDSLRQRSETKKLLDSISLAISPDSKIKSLSIAEMQMVEIVRAISFNAEVLIMDEPTSAITEREVAKLFEIILMSKKRGIAIVYITHKMDEIFQIADTVSVMRDGKHIATQDSSAVTRDGLISMMVGREITAFFPKEQVDIGAVTLKVRNLSKQGKFRNISFDAHSGEILGIAGLMGAGRTEVAEAIMGLNPPDSGEIYINEVKVRIRTPHDSIAAGIAFVPEDRKLKGLNLIASVGHNITITNLNSFCFANIVNRRRERQAIDNQIKALSIKTPHRDRTVNSLSGGNQQKVVLAKSLVGTPEVFVFDEPTRGIDVGAKTEIYRIMTELAKAGKTIIMISSEMPEIIGMSDSVLVFCEGTITNKYLRSEFDQEKILADAMAHRPGARNRE